VLLAAYVIAAAFEDLAIDADIAELVDDERDPPSFGILQEMADQCRLAGTEKAGDDGRGDFLEGHLDHAPFTRRFMAKAWPRCGPVEEVDILSIIMSVHPPRAQQV